MGLILVVVCQNLEELDLSDNNLSNAAVLVLGKSISQHSSLQHFTLCDNPIDLLTSLELLELLENAKLLTKLKLDGTIAAEAQERLGMLQEQLNSRMINKGVAAQQINQERPQAIKTTGLWKAGSNKARGMKLLTTSPVYDSEGETASFEDEEEDEEVPDEGSPLFKCDAEYASWELREGSIQISDEVKQAREQAGWNEASCIEECERGAAREMELSRLDFARMQEMRADRREMISEWNSGTMGDNAPSSPKASRTPSKPSRVPIMDMHAQSYIGMDRETRL